MKSLLFFGTSTRSYFQIENIYYEDDTSTSQRLREIVFKEHPVFIPMTIASAPISSPVVDEHPIAITDYEPIEDVDPVAPDVDQVALDIVMDITLKGSKRVYPQFHMTTLSTCRSMSMVWVMYQIRLPTKKPLLVLNPTYGSMQ